MKIVKIALSLAFLLITLLGTKKMVAQELASIELGGVLKMQVKVCGVFKSDRSLWVYKPGDPDNVQEFIISEDAKNFDQIEVGDLINISYYESVALSLNTPGKLPEEEDGIVIMRAAEGEAPGGIAMEVYDISAIVRAYDEESGIVTLMGPKGKVFKTKAEGRMVDPSEIEVGQTLHVRYTKTLAIDVEKL
jgi:hypothetical protein